jgi:predicted dehydrogenase
MKPVKVGVVGCGAISNAYFTHGKAYSRIMTFDAVADMLPDKASEAAQKHGVPRVLSVEQLLGDPDIEVVLNLTIPKAHAPVALQAIAQGKHHYSEKPFGVTREEGQAILKAAQAKGVRTGCAPDTFFGAGHQTARKLIDDGAIGRPLVATAFMMGRGHESWHPNPEFYYEPGGGPMLDMGPYYLTAMINMLGPIVAVNGMADVMIPQRTITHKNKDGGPGPKFGKTIQVQTPDHVTGCIRFQCGAIGTIIQSFATAHSVHDGKNPITIHGSEGTLRVPDPNGFDGTVYLRKLADAEWQEVAPTHTTGLGRAAGLADLAKAIRTDRPHRASGELAFNVLDAMIGFLDSGVDGRTVAIEGRYDRPAALPVNLPLGEMD